MKKGKISIIITAGIACFILVMIMFMQFKIVYETDKTSSELSDAISKDLKKRGMKFVGTTIIYSYLQAIGVIYSHEEGCFLKNN